MPRSYYPPRADSSTSGNAPCAILPQFIGSCDPGDSAQFAFLNDVDTVAAATPPYGAPFTGTWVVPDAVARRRLRAARRGREGVRHRRRQPARVVHQRGRGERPSTSTGRRGTSARRRCCSACRSPSGRAPRPARRRSTSRATATGRAPRGDVHAPDGTHRRRARAAAPGGWRSIDGPTGPGRVHVARVEGCPDVRLRGDGAAAVRWRSSPRRRRRGRAPPCAFTSRTRTAARCSVTSCASRCCPSADAAIDPSTFPAWTPAGVRAGRRPGQRDRRRDRRPGAAVRVRDRDSRARRVRRRRRDIPALHDAGRPVRPADRLLHRHRRVRLGAGARGAGAARGCATRRRRGARSRARRSTLLPFVAAVRGR